MAFLDCSPHAARRTAAVSSPLHRRVADVALAGLVLSSAALARTVNNCDIRVGILCHRLNLSAAKLQRANLGSSNLAGAAFSGADLRGTRFESANLAGANLRGARIDATTDFGRANVEGCIGCPVMVVRKP